MKTSESELKAIRDRGTRAATRDGCLSADELAMTARGEIGAAERERVADHLATCADCSEELRLIAPLQAWSERTAVAYGREPQSLPAASWLWAWQLASVLLVVTAGGMLAWNVALRQDNADLIATAARPPQMAAIAPAGDRSIPSSITGAINVPIIDLQPDTLRGAGDATRMTSVRAASDLITLILNTDLRDGTGAYRLAVIDATGRIVWQSDALTMTEFRTFTVALPPRALGPGAYRLELSRPGAATLLNTYTLRIEPE